MRMTTRLREESGVAAVLVVLMLVVLIAMMALAIDGGLLWSKFRRVRNANDAAALAAALSCAKGEGLTTANLKASEYAKDNVTDAAAVEPNLYPRGCEVAGGEVTVHYGGQQTLMFGPAVGVSSPKPVSALATATWGGAGGSDDVVPLTLMKNSLSTCNFVPGPGVTLPAIGTMCGFWWDDDAIGNATWGYMNLLSWPEDETEDVPSLNGCSSAGGVGEMQDAIENGYHTLVLVPPPPTYVCAENGAYSQPINNSILDALAAGRTDFAFPVSDPALTVYTPCNQPGCIPSPYKYGIVGFAFLQPVGIYKRNDLEYQTYCSAFLPITTANSRCLIAKYVGFSSNGLYAGGGENFGLTAVGLTK